MCVWEGGFGYVMGGEGEFPWVAWPTVWKEVLGRGEVRNMVGVCGWTLVLIGVGLQVCVGMHPEGIQPPAGILTSEFVSSFLRPTSFPHVVVPRAGGPFFLSSAGPVIG